MTTVKDTTTILDKEALKALDNTASLLDDLKKSGLFDWGKDPKKKPAAKKPASGKAPEKEDTPVKPAATVREYKTRMKGKDASPSSAREESTAVAMSTDAFSKEILTEFQKRTKAIKSSIGKIDTSLETIAFNLHWVDAKQAYKAEGYPTIIEYAAEVCGYQKTTCYSYLDVVDRFAKRNEKGEILESFDERVKGFSVSKLSVMVKLTDSEIETLNPTMSVRDIKRFVKGLEEKALSELSEGNGEPDEDETADDNVIDSTATVFNTLIKCTGKADYDKKIDEIDECILRLFNQHPDAVIEVSYTLPATKEE